MPIDKHSVERTAIFLFAHQDDEFGVFQQIREEASSGRAVRCAYLTDGRFDGVPAERRNRESLAVLDRLGVQSGHVHFAGNALSIPDAYLPEHMGRASRWIDDFLKSISGEMKIFVPAWEGGHHDHDALHAITVGVAQKTGRLKHVRQFPLYNGFGLTGPLFRVFFPLAQNGAVEKTRIPLKNRVRYLRCCMGYPSQAVSWMGLFPHVLFHYFARGTQILQPVCAERVRQRPHPGRLYYERRGFFSWHKMDFYLDRWSAQPLTRQTNTEAKRSVFWEKNK